MDTPLHHLTATQYPSTCRQDGTRINNGNISNSDPYTHWTYFYQDWLTYWPNYNRTIAHVSYRYDVYTGDATYLQQQQSQYYKSTTGSDKYGWYPYPDNNWMPYICEKPQALFGCNISEAPPSPDTPFCLPNDNDTLYCPVNQTSCYFYISDNLNLAAARTKCSSLKGYIVSWDEGPEQLQIESWVAGTCEVPPFRGAACVPVARRWP